MGLLERLSLYESKNRGDSGLQMAVVGKIDSLVKESPATGTISLLCGAGEDLSLQSRAEVIKLYCMSPYELI